MKPNSDDQDVTYTITFDSDEIKMMSAALLLASLNDAMHENARAMAARLNHKLTQVRLGIGSVEQEQEMTR